MNTILWLVLSLAVLDGFLLTLFYFMLRGHAPLQGRTMLAISAGLAGFAVHALIFFSGGFLILQLATIGGLFTMCLLVPRHQHDSR